MIDKEQEEVWWLAEKSLEVSTSFFSIPEFRGSFSSESRARFEEKPPVNW